MRSATTPYKMALVILAFDEPVVADTVRELCAMDGAQIVSMDTERTGAPWYVDTCKRCVVRMDGELTASRWVDNGIMPNVYLWQVGDRK